MRKREKEKLLEIIDTLVIGIKETEQLIKLFRYADAATLLTDCQAAAVAVGNEIEKCGEQGDGIIRQLEELCELIYQCVAIEELEEKMDICATLERKFGQVRDEMTTGIKEEKLVVFLPYKASMWDSLESVWRAADEDEDWLSVVMPIPYFDKKPDGTLGEMQYEGGDFPKDVPIADWQQFSLEKEHPDMIFIHNPYDQYNSVTTVHPMFYSSRIKAYTEKLVYIPYFIHQNDMVADYYCVLPGTIYSDIVVLQSEKVREQYIKYYEEGLPKLVQKQGKQAVEAKFQAWGSPKLDACDRQEDEIPEEWQRLLGNGEKKVIFFNTHLSGLMKGKSELFLKKVEWVFRLFAKRDDVVLLWRPHPLSLDTAKAMNPEVVEPYLKLVEEYKRQGFGIYDDTKDLHRAVNLADAYYGNGSSVTELFRLQNKPVMIMCDEVIEE